MSLFSLFFGKPVPATNALEVSEKLKSGKHPLVIDVRQADEYRSGHIAGAKLIPLGELNRRMKELPQNREIICVCASGNRSRSATKMLNGAGYQAVNLKGGIGSWKRASFKVKKGDAA